MLISKLKLLPQNQKQNKKKRKLFLSLIIIPQLDVVQVHIKENYVNFNTKNILL